MSDHAILLEPYRRIREVLFRLNHQIVKEIPKKVLEDCAKILGFFEKGAIVFDTEDEAALLMDYCLYYPGRDGRNLVADHLQKSPPLPNSDEMAALQAMTHAYYSMFYVVDVEKGVGVSVRDLLRDESGFIVDVGFGTTARRQMVLATRIISMEGLLMTGGAALPIDPAIASRISDKLTRAGYSPERIDFRRITPR